MTIEELRQKASWVWRQTLLLHARAPETRVASSLSPVEILTTLYYLPVLRYDPCSRFSPARDRFIVSKGHGSICLYPILADLGFFPLSELERICRPGSFLGGIPDPVIPGYESVNGSLGHGPGVACGIAMALRRDSPDLNAVVLAGDAELHEGAVWEAAAFAAHHRLDNLLLIVDDNRHGMLGPTEETLSVSPIRNRFEAFGWEAEDCDGHDLSTLSKSLSSLARRRGGKPKLLVARTVKGRGVPGLEGHPLCHILTIPPEQVCRLVQ